MMNPRRWLQAYRRRVFLQLRDETPGWRYYRCRLGHEWFPDIEPREFIPVHQICVRCDKPRVLLPWGQCLRDHPIAEHYWPGTMLAHETSTCPAPL